MLHRIVGLETEFGVTCTMAGRDRPPVTEVVNNLFAPVDAWSSRRDVFLPNGARLYVDTGDHPEYATPECDDLAQLVVWDKAGERILDDLALAAERQLGRSEDAHARVFMFKNNTDSAGHSYGCHENYLVDRNLDFSRVARVLLPFLVTR